MNDIPDHPIIHNCELTGYPDGKTPPVPHCPICGQECESIYRGLFGIIEGCNVCLEVKDAWEVPECFPE